MSSQKGKGSNFTIRLLLANLKHEESPLIENKAIDYQGSRKKIMVVDDQEEQRNLVVILLEPLGFQLYTAHSGEMCLQQYEAYQPDLILLDLTMGGINGIQTATRIRQSGSDIPIIVLSANAYPSDRQKAIDAGCNDFISKPINISELLSKLKLHLSLNWIFQGADIEEVLPATSDPVILPPPNIIEDLNQYVKIGDLLGLKQQLNELIKMDASYQSFAHKIRALANKFRIAEIKKILAEDNETK